MVEIRKATALDHQRVRSWLEEDDAAGRQGFWCNERVIAKIFEEGNLRVALEGDDPVGFLAGATSHPDILEVRHDRRGRGIGRLLVEDLLERAWHEDLSIIRLECSPHASLRFWKHMGFRELRPLSYSIFRNPRAFRLVDYDYGPAQGDAVKVRLALLRVRPKSPAEAKPLFEWKGVGALANGEVHLPSRVVLFDVESEGDPDNILEIEVNGACLYRDKVKYPEAADFGVDAAADGAYFIEVLNQVT